METSVDITEKYLNTRSSMIDQNTNLKECFNENVKNKILSNSDNIQEQKSILETSRNKPIQAH